MENNKQEEKGSTGCLTVATIAFILIVIIAALSDFVEKNTGILIALSILVGIWIIKKASS